MISSVNGFSMQDLYANQTKNEMQAFLNSQQQNQQTQAVQEQQQQELQGSVMTSQKNSSFGREIFGKNGCTDGKDDGKTGILSKIFHGVKGMTVGFVKGFVGIDKDGKWHPGQLIKNLAIAAGCAALHVLTFGASTAVICGITALTSGGGIVKSAIAAANSTTDKENKDAWEDIGTNTSALLLSLFGMKTNIKNINSTAAKAGTYDGISGMGRAIKDSGKMLWEKGGLAKAEIADAWHTDGFNGLKGLVSQTWQNFKAASKPKSVQENQDTRVKNYKDKINDIDKKLRDTKLSDKEKLELGKQKTQLENELNTMENAFNEINKKTSFEDAQKCIDDQSSTIAETQRNIDATKKLVAEAKDDVSKKTWQKKVDILENKLKAQESTLDIYKKVVDQKVMEARNIRAEMKRLLAKKKTGDKDVNRYCELDKQKEALQFELPEEISYMDRYNARVNASTKTAHAENALQVAKDNLRANPKDANLQRDVWNKQIELDKARIAESRVQAKNTASSGADRTGAAMARWKTVNSTLNEQYGTMPLSGSKIPFTKRTLPTISKFYLYPAALGTITNGSSTSTPEDQLQQLSQEQQMALLLAAQQEASQATAQDTSQLASTTGASPQTGPTLADYQQLDSALKAYGVT